MKCKILFLAANPSDEARISTDREAREIEEKILTSPARNQFELVTKWAVRVGDLQRHLLAEKPHIVHFSGHGSESGELVFTGPDGIGQTVENEALEALFSTWKDQIRVVFLNSCFSRLQAQSIARAIDCVVGMNGAVYDNPAIHFSSAFYQALGFKRSIQEAFDSGKVELKLHKVQLLAFPELIVRDGVDPAQTFLDPRANF